MRSAWLPVGLVLLGAAGAPLACGAEFQATGSATSSAGGGAPTTTGMGGTDVGSSSSTDSASSTTASSTSTGAGGCKTAQDCPGTTTLCGEVTCTAGACGFQKLQGDVPSFSQVYGDCHVVECKDGHPVNKVEDKETYDDGIDCTVDACMNGVASNLVPTDGQCGITNHCTAAGACVECLADGDCTEGTTPKCQGNRCVPSGCTDGLKGLDEPDVDCGGAACAPCDDGKFCGKAGDCVSGICSVKSGEVLKTCHHDCNDGVKNGTETGPDCGGPTCGARCSAAEGCLAPGDCKSGVCQAGLCKAPTCTDGVKNGGETGIDCGTGCPHACPGVMQL